MQSQYFVVTFGLRPEIDYDTLEFVGEGEELSLGDRLIILLYFALTTLSTVGYGDLFPTSILEKAIGVAIEIIGVTIFSILMNNFAEITISIIGDSFTSKEEHLVRWFAVIKHIRNQPFGGGKNVSVELREKIEAHFRHFWNNDRAGIILSKEKYFQSIPQDIRELIMTEFLFRDLLHKPAFRTFISGGQSMSDKFTYDLSFGFVPRFYAPNADERYLIEEESDVTEIYFIMKGEWAVAFNCFVPPEDADVQEEQQFKLGGD